MLTNSGPQVAVLEADLGITAGTYVVILDTAFGLSLDSFDSEDVRALPYIFKILRDHRGAQAAAQ